MKRIDLSTLDLSPEVQQRLSLSLDRVIAGSDDVIMTPVAERIGPKNMLAQWDAIFERNKTRLNSVLLSIENEQRAKFGPRSIAVTWEERKDALYEYFEPDKSNSHDILAKNESNINKGRLRPYNLNNAAGFIKKTTNSGLPFLAKKGRVLDETVDNFPQLLNRQDPCMMFTRTQESKKTRTVWGFPIADTLNEMMFYRPVLESQKTAEWRTAIVSPDAVDRAITKLMSYAEENGLALVSIDFSKYDASISQSLIDSAFIYVNSMFQSGYEEQINYVRDRFKTIGIVTPDGIVEGPHGVPSGSTFTNEIDSIVQYLIVVNSTMDLEYFQIQGDDGAYATSDPEALFELFKSHGLNVNEDKSYTSYDYLVYLQLLYHKDYTYDGVVRGVYPIYRALNRLAYQERFDDISKEDITGKDYYAIRTLSILENLKYHPLFREFVEFVIQLDKYSLIPSDQGLSSYVKLRLKQDGKDINFNIHQYGDDPQGIKSFESYKLVKELTS